MKFYNAGTLAGRNFSTLQVSKSDVSGAPALFLEITETATRESTNIILNREQLAVLRDAINTVIGDYKRDDLMWEGKI